MRVKDKLRSRDVEIGEELIQDTLPNQNTSTDDDIDIKYEEIGFPFHNATSESEDKSNLDSATDTVPDIPHVACASDKTEQNDPIEFYIEHFQCVRGCETCQKYIELLSNHIRAIHTPLQPIEDPLPIDPPQPHQSLSIPIKIEVDEDIEKMLCSEQQSEPKLVADLDLELGSVIENDPHYSESTALIRNVRPHSFKNHSSRGSKISKINKWILPPRPHFKCNECSKSFKYLYLLNAHKRTHTGEQPFQCDVCGKCFTLKSSLTEHKRIHTGEKPFKCDECGKTFGKGRHLKTHERSHTGEKPYSCALCEKSFIASGDLIRHKRFHTGEKPYECTVCKKRFGRSSALTEHTRIHTGDKPYHCDECEKSFSQRSGLTTHKRSHTGERPNTRLNPFVVHKTIHTRKKRFECGECVKNFSCQSSLATHMRIHRGEKFYECDQCEKSFSQKNNLTVHKRSHTGKKPFMCDECEKKFSTSGNLTQHKRKIHTRESTQKN